MKTTLTVFLALCLAYSVGCATKTYYYHPDKTPAEIEMDYSQCMYSISTRFQRSANISGPLEKCMRSKGYEGISEREARQRGIKIPEIWPPYSSRSSSTGP
jgi:hypothetical protein